MKYDYLIVGAGLFGATFAYEANKRGKMSMIMKYSGNKKPPHFCEGLRMKGNGGCLSSV